MLKIRNWYSHLTIVLVFLLGTACSPVDFEVTEEFLKANDLSQTSVLINGGDTFTNDGTVLLSLDGRGADEMKVSQNEDCSDGEWEPYAPEKYWNLSAENKKVAVYVMFRRPEIKEDSGCQTDDIIHDGESPQVSFYRENGLWSQAVDYSVPFSATDALSGIAKVECSRDGNTYESCENKVDIIGQAEGPQFVYVRAADVAGNVSESVPFNWNVDRTPPVVTVHSQPSSVTNLTSATIEFSGADSLSTVSHFYCRFDSGIQSLCQSPLTKNGLSQGEHKLIIKAVDKAGNVSEPAEVTWSIDREAPTVEITEHPAPISKLNTGQFKFIGRDGAQVLTSFLCSIDGSTYSACSSPHAFAGLTDGAHTFRVKALDMAGNESAPAEYSWVIDTLAPTLSFVKVPPAYSNQVNAAFGFQTLDAPGLTNDASVKIYCGLSLASLNECSLNQTISLTVDGTYQLYAKAVDKAGNESAVITHSWMLDRVAPLLTLENLPNSVIGAAIVSISYTATDDRSGIHSVICDLNDGGMSVCPNPRTFTELAEGAYVLKYQALDKAGNASAVQAVTWNVDKTAPSIEFLQTPTDTTVDYPSQVQFKVMDSGHEVPATNLQCFFNGVLQAECTSQAVYTLLNREAGEASFKVVARDDYGNVREETVTWQVYDIAPPQPMLTSIFVKAQNKVDVLFVVDNSGSMADIQREMADRISGFINNVQGLDWQIAFTLTDVYYKKNQVVQDGVLVPLEGSGSDLNSIGDSHILNSSMDAAVVERVFGETVQREEEGSGAEQGIYASYRAVERAFQSGELNSANRRFFRDDASLSIVLISDENETPDHGHKNRPQDLIQIVNNKYDGSKNLSFNSLIVQPGDQECLDSRGWSWIPFFGWHRIGQYGQAYADLSNRLGAGSEGGSLIGSVCESDYTSQLVDIGKSVKAMVKTATLECDPVANSIKVYSVDNQGIETPYSGTYSLNALKIIFDNELPIGDYNIRYECQP